MSKRTAVAAAGAVAAVGVAVGWRVAGARSGTGGSTGHAPRDSLIVDDVDGGRFIASLSEAITFRTVVLDNGTYDSEAFDALGAMLTRRYPLVHEELLRETFEGHGLLYTWQGADPRLDPIVLMAHQDVVPVERGAEDDWVAAPFTGSVVDGRLYGRGALDCKGPLIAIFEAIEHLLERDETPDRTVHVVSGHDEEIGGARGSKVIAAEMHVRGITPWFVVDEGGVVADGILPAIEAPVALIGISEKGFMNVRLTARGEGGHSSVPPSGSAIVKLAEAISRLDANPVPAKIDAITPMLSALSEYLPGVLGVLASKPSMLAPLLSRAFARDERMDALQRTTMIPTMIEGGIKTNVVPQAASVIVNVRIIPGDTSTSVLDHVRGVVGVGIEVEVLPEFLKEPSRFSSIDSEAWDTVTGVVRDVFPEAIVAPYVLTAGTDSRFFEPFAGDVYRFSPFVLGNDGLAGLHGTNEFVRVEDAQRAVTFFVRLIAVAARTGDSP
ncbi:MAG: M20/M25/M40 family metallo-hydrolase [Acidimicrobiia bacterium]